MGKTKGVAKAKKKNWGKGKSTTKLTNRDKRVITAQNAKRNAAAVNKKRKKSGKAQIKFKKASDARR